MSSSPWGAQVLEIDRQIRIDQPVEVVRAQFADVIHHQAASPHRGVEFRVLSDDGVRCEYEQHTRLGPVRSRQRLVLERGDPARQVNRIVEGLFEGGTITFEIDGDGDGDGDGETSRVTAILRAELRGGRRMAAPAVRWVAGRSLAKALGEDRDLLESGGYVP